LKNKIVFAVLLFLLSGLLLPSDSFAQTSIPDWVKNNADWWSQGLISDKDFAVGLGFMVKEGIVKVDNIEFDSEGSLAVSDDIQIPKWIHNNAKWWVDGEISDDDFKSGIQFMVKEKVIDFAEKKEIVKLQIGDAPVSKTSIAPSIFVSDDVVDKAVKNGAKISLTNQFISEWILELTNYETEVIDDAIDAAWDEYSQTDDKNTMNHAIYLQNLSTEQVQKTSDALKLVKQSTALTDNFFNVVQKNGHDKFQLITEISELGDFSDPTKIKTEKQKENILKDIKHKQSDLRQEWQSLSLLLGLNYFWSNNQAFYETICNSEPLVTDRDEINAIPFTELCDYDEIESDMSDYIVEDELIIDSVLIQWDINDIYWIDANNESNETNLVQIINPEINILNPNLINFFNVHVWSDTDINGIDITVSETNKASGIFEGTMLFTIINESSGNKLKVTEGDTVTMKYQDNTLPNPYTQADDLDVSATTLIGHVVPPLENAPPANLRLIDAFGNRLDSVTVDQQAEIDSDLVNGHDGEQTFVYLVEIQDENGITVSLAWNPGSLSAGQSFSPALSWIPTDAGTYNVSAFVWELPVNPTELSPPVSTTGETTTGETTTGETTTGETTTGETTTGETTTGETTTGETTTGETSIDAWIPTYVISNQVFPQKQFSWAEPGEHCDDWHIHVTYAYDVDAQSISLTDPSPGGCGFGTITSMIGSQTKMTTLQISAWETATGMSIN